MNNKTVTGAMINASGSSVTITSGTITKTSGWTLINRGTMTASKLNVYHTNDDDNGCGVMNHGTLTFSDGYIHSNVHVFTSSGNGTVAKVYNSTLEGKGNGNEY